MSGPVLPWGAAAAAAAPQPEQIIDRDVLKTLGLEAGARIEVKWELEVDEEDCLDEQSESSPPEVWWPATIGSLVEDGTKSTDGEGRLVYQIIYDASPELGFTESVLNTVSFLDNHSIYDVGEDERFFWRIEGDSWDETPKDNDGPFTLREVLTDMNKAERLRGKTNDEELLEMLDELPQEKQRVVAGAFADMSSILSAGISRLAEENGPGYVIKREDIEKIMQEIKERTLGE